MEQQYVFYCFYCLFFLFRYFHTGVHFRAGSRSLGIISFVWILATFVFVNIYSSCMSSYMSLQSQRPDINTFQDLASNPDYLPLTFKGASLENYFIVLYLYFRHWILPLKTIIYTSLTGGKIGEVGNHRWQIQEMQWRLQNDRLWWDDKKDSSGWQIGHSFSKCRTLIRSSANNK